MKVFNEEHPKSDVFNEALITARIEETGLDIPKVKGVSLVEGKWALEIEYKDGKTMEDMMNSDKKNIEKYMEDFVDLQLQIHGKTSPLLKGMKDKLARQINSLKDWMQQQDTSFLQDLKVCRNIIKYATAISIRVM